MLVADCTCLVLQESREGHSHLVTLTGYNSRAAYYSTWWWCSVYIDLCLFQRGLTEYTGTLIIVIVLTGKPSEPRLYYCLCLASPTSYSSCPGATHLSSWPSLNILTPSCLPHRYVLSPGPRSHAVWLPRNCAMQFHFHSAQLLPFLQIYAIMQGWIASEDKNFHIKAVTTLKATQQQKHIFPAFCALGAINS